MRVCDIKNCGKVHFAKGYCSKHFQRFRIYGDPLKVRFPRNLIYPKICTVEGCTNKFVAKGYCWNHYMINRLNGGPTIRNKNEKGKGHINKNGYKEYKVNGKVIYEHRAIVEKYIGRKLLPFPQEVIHHIDGNKLNNHISNLCVMSASKHASMHLKIIRNQ